MEEKTFGERLKKLRKEANITQNDFADKLLVHSQTVSRWERGLIEPDISQLGEIAAAFCVTLEKLLDLPESEKTYSGAFDPAAFGKTLCEKRTQKNESQELLADYLSEYNVSPDTVSRWERGVTCPDIPQLVALAEHFACPVSELYCGMGEKEKAESESVTYVKRGRRAGRIVAAAVIAGCLLTGAGAMAAVTQYKKSAANSYDVSFDGEIISVSSLQSYMPETPQKAGYDFCGWVNESGETVQFPRTITGNEEYYSVFAPHEYYIDFWLNGGEFTAEAQNTITVENGEVSLILPQKAGAEFRGWYLTPDYSGEVAVSVRCACSDIKLYAKWSDAVYTVRYELYGGTMYDVNPDTVTAEEEIALHAPVKKGHKFVGWYESPYGGTTRADKAAGGIAAMNGGNAANKISTVGGKNARNLTLYALWQKTDEKYTVSYDCMGGITSAENPGIVRAGEVFTLNGAEKFGYEFIGWNDLPDGTGAYYEKLYDLQADLKLYAIFRAKTYLIRYEYTGAYENEKINPNFISYEDRAELYPVNKRGYEFIGWYTEKSGGEKIEAIDSSNVAFLSVLYARFSPVTYILKLDADGGSIVFSATDSDETESATYEYSLTVESASFYLPSCKKAGYDFVGWQDKERGERLSKIDSLDVKNRTLTAIWRDSEKTYKITYVLNMSAAENPNPTEAKCKNTLFLAEAQAGGYDFLGWYDNAAGDGAAITKIAKGNEKDITLYALWQELKTYGSTEFFDYEETSSGVTITNYKGAWGASVTVNVPAYINGSPVVALKCKFGQSSVNKEGVNKEYNAINLPDGMVILGERAFALCRVKDALKIPAGVREIGALCFGVFYGNVYFDERNTIETIGENAFFECCAENVLTLPETVRTIKRQGFNRSRFSGIVLPDGIISIEDNALYTQESNCIVFIPDTVRYLGECAYGNSAFTNLSSKAIRAVSAKPDSMLLPMTKNVSKSVLTLRDGSGVQTTEEDYAFVLPRREKEGYRFIGWADAGGNIVNEYYVPLGNQTLCAQYIRISETDGLTEKTPAMVTADEVEEIYISPDFDYYFVLNAQRTVTISVVIDIVPDDAYDYCVPLHVFSEENELQGTFEYEQGTVLKICFDLYKTRPPCRIKIKVIVLS